MKRQVLKLITFLLSVHAVSFAQVPTPDPIGDGGETSTATTPCDDIRNEFLTLHSQKQAVEATIALHQQNGTTSSQAYIDALQQLHSLQSQIDSLIVEAAENDCGNSTVMPPEYGDPDDDCEEYYDLLDTYSRALGILLDTLVTLEAQLSANPGDQALADAILGMKDMIVDIRNKRLDLILAKPEECDEYQAGIYQLSSDQAALLYLVVLTHNP